MRQSQSIDAAQTSGMSAQFQRRWEAGFHWRGMTSMLLGTPGLRAAWPMSVIDYQNPQVTDISGNGYDLTNNAGVVTFGRDPAGLTPRANFGGAVNQYLSRADGGAGNWADITGAEAFIQGADQGLTLGGWFFWAALPAANHHLVSKGTIEQYDLILLNTNLVRFRVWPGAIFVETSAVIIAGWNHIVGRYDRTSQTLFIYLNGVETIGGVGAAPAALADTAGAFAIGANAAGNNRLVGRASDCFLSAVSLSQGFVKAGYHYTKAAFGVK